MKIPTRTVESGISVPGELGRFHLWNGLEGVRLRFLDSPMDGQKKKKEEKKLVIRYKYKLFLSDSVRMRYKRDGDFGFSDNLYSRSHWNKIRHADRIGNPALIQRFGPTSTPTRTL